MERIEGYVFDRRMAKKNAKSSRRRHNELEYHHRRIEHHHRIVLTVFLVIAIGPCRFIIRHRFSLSHPPASPASFIIIASF